MEYIISVIDKIDTGGEQSEKKRNFQVIESRLVAKEEKSSTIYRGSWIDEEKTPYGQDFIKVDNNELVEKINKKDGQSMFRLEKGKA